ncbi:MAG: DNA primase, partial [Nanoarchaeota archaeon]|nr:DNA primase [Nanoarchaeota archaeon]
MAKISPVSIKYMIYASFRAEGPLEKPDVIGALFGQTEGLLGSDMELRELQKEGKIGRIEVELEVVDGKSIGEIQVPTAMDKSATTLIAAALETIDRVGPTEAKIEIGKIEDVRGGKRDYILERAKKLMVGMDEGSFKEMSDSLKVESRAEKIQEYGGSRLPCGDLSGNELLVVEGRADVVNLLRNRVNNVIGMDGTKLPPEIAELGKEKELTLFVDGDRGGKLIANNVIYNATVKYVAVAPEGKEVEELTGKEILQALRKKVSVEEYSNGKMPNGKEPEEAKNFSVEFKGDVKERLREI